MHDSFFSGKHNGPMIVLPDAEVLVERVNGVFDLSFTCGETVVLIPRLDPRYAEWLCEELGKTVDTWEEVLAQEGPDSELLAEMRERGAAPSS